jgi:hypothetical protein
MEFNVIVERIDGWAGRCLLDVANSRVGMCTKFTCCLLARHYREIDENEEVSGGPMYYLRDGLKLPFLQR